MTHQHHLKNRFRGFLPIVIDVETAGFEAKTDALLEMAAISVQFSEEGLLIPDESFHAHVVPFESARLDPKALEFTKIDPYHPFRFAEAEGVALERMFQFIATGLKKHRCHRAVLVGHNPSFDMGFIQAAVRRNKENVSKNPFHGFTTLDTATLSALAFGQTVLAKSCRAAGIGFDPEQAHSALYDASRTADLFCHIVNLWQPFHLQKKVTSS